MDSVSNQKNATATLVNGQSTVAQFKLKIPPVVQVTAHVLMASLCAQIKTAKRVSTLLGHNGRHVIGRVVLEDKSVSSSTCSKMTNAPINPSINHATVTSVRALIKTEPCGLSGGRVPHRAAVTESNTVI